MSSIRLQREFRLGKDERILTSRLEIRRPVITRLPRTYFLGLRDPSVLQYTESRFDYWTRLKAIRFLLNANSPGNSVLFAVHTLHGNTWIGNVRLFNWNPHHRTAELSFLFFDRTFWNCGFATEAVDAILKFAREKLHVRRVYGDHYANNNASGKLFSKLNFQIEGISREHFLTSNGPIDSVRVGRILDA